MFGRFLIPEYAVLATIIIVSSHLIAICISRLITYRIGKDNSHSYAYFTYKHLNRAITTYITLIEVLLLITIWAGYLASIILTFLASLLIVLRYVYGRKAKEFLGILNIVRFNKCDIGDYISGDNFSGKVVKFYNYYLELEDLNGAYFYVSGEKIKTLVNNSRNVFDVKIEIEIPNTKQLGEVTKVLEKELPSLIQDYPIILEGPNIDGVGHISESSYTLILSTKVKYEDIDRVTKAINAKVVMVLGK